MGLVGCLLVAIAHPVPLALIPPEAFLARPALWLRALSRHRGTVSPAPNFAYGLAVRRIRDEELDGVDLSPWRLALCGAEPVSPAVLRRFTARFAAYGLDPAAPTPVYGLSEATLAVTFGAVRRRFAVAAIDPVRLARTGEVADGPRELASVGRPIPGMEVEIRDSAGAARPDGRLGRIWVRGPSLMLGYLGNDAATRAVLRDGWLDTGDLGFVRDGELYVAGRAKDAIVLRGRNHAPQEFEDALDGLAGLRPGGAVAVGVVPDGADGEELALLVERERATRPGPVEPAEALAERIRAAVLERTGIRPHQVRLLAPGTLPRTSSGKLRRGEARRRFLAGTLAPPAKVTPLRLAGEVLRSRLALVRAKIS
jgi:acyl-CoA synthetase (AMP-forming)/AMP-acid ligase II